jgi:hypothetical protein
MLLGVAPIARVRAPSNDDRGFAAAARVVHRVVT